jgi:LmbE family N-acetylglucosaminyl deacetylase
MNLGSHVISQALARTALIIGRSIARQCFFIGVMLVALWQPIARGDDAPGGAAILQDLKSFNTLGSVLMVAAHPDDENTQLITYLARGRGYRMAYLSLTRGDGGQNLLGPEFGEELGLIRTQELLAARRLDGGRQYFTRAIDFGFSKDYKKTLAIWDRQEVLGDVVRVIRTFRPDVIVTRFSIVPGNTHGHHTASAVLALDAFKISGDPKAYPEQLVDGITPWQPRRIFMNAGAGGGRPGATTANAGAVVRIDDGGVDPVIGQTFAIIARRSRAMHKTQGFGNFAGAGGRGAHQEAFTLLDGEPATNDILDGVDTTWGRIPNGAEIGTLTSDAIAKFDIKDPAASVPALLAIRSKLMALPADILVIDKREQFDRILASCLGLSVETTIPQAEIVPGEALHLHHTAAMTSNVAVKWTAVRYPATSAQVAVAIELQTIATATRDGDQVLPTNTSVSQPYWLREPGTAGMFHVDDPKLIGRPENPSAFPVEFDFEVGGQTLTIADEPVQITTDPQGKEQRRRVDVIPPVWLKFASDVELFGPSETKKVEVQATASRAKSTGTLRLDIPDGWKVSPATQSFDLAGVGDHTAISFSVTAPPAAASANITASVEINGATYSNQRIEINYDHIPHLLLQPAARLKAVALDLAIRGQKVGYIAGAGDSVADGLSQMGYKVTQLTGADLTPEKLHDLDAVVIGIRAFNVRTDLAANLPALFAYVKDGGTVIEQYNRPDGLQNSQLAPYPLQLSSSRVTDEAAKMTFLAPDHSALNTPNKITDADFDGWVQERGIYYPSQWDDHFTPILACSDAGEAPLQGGLLIAHDGKGYFVYTSLVFFRQLPAGNPGAYRLFANLVSLGK